MLIREAPESLRNLLGRGISHQESARLGASGFDEDFHHQEARRGRA